MKNRSGWAFSFFIYLFYIYTVYIYIHASSPPGVCVNVEHGTPPLDHQFHHEVVPNLAQPNGVKRFPALETRFHYQHDTPFSPSGACTSVEMSETMEEVER